MGAANRAGSLVAKFIDTGSTSLIKGGVLTMGSGRCFLATFRPLIKRSSGRLAATKFSLPPFIDGSCRREPNFESSFPSVTATCRTGRFAPRLDVGDRIAYLTVKGKYLDDSSVGWRLVAVLRVIERFESHELAAAWYTQRELPLPSNCHVEGNSPKAFELTNGRPPDVVSARLATEFDPKLAVRLWDATYRARIIRWPVFLICEATYLELFTPPSLRESDLIEVLGAVPVTQNPPRIDCEKMDKLKALALARKTKSSEG